MGNPRNAVAAMLAQRLGASGIRVPSGDALALLEKRLPRIPKRQATGELLAVNPLDVVRSSYIDFLGDEALERAARLQRVSPIQYLDEGRWYDNRMAGVSGQELPLLLYPNKSIPGERGALGLFRLSEGPKAAVQVAVGGEYPMDVLAEEARHALDRGITLASERPASLSAPRATGAMMAVNDPGEVQEYMEYLSLPSETRATLSGLLADAGEFIDTPQQATSLLERAADAGGFRERATAEGILNSRSLRNEYIPYLLKALGVGGVMAGTDMEEP